PEYGTANGRLHFHAVHFMRTLPTGSVDPNFGRRVRNRRQLNIVASIMENTNLSKQQQVSEIMRQMLTQAQTAGQYFTNDQIKEMTRKVSAEVDLVHQQTQNQRYGSSHIGATAKDISNVVTDAASGVVDIFH